MKCLLALSFVAAVGSIELTPANWDKETAGKTVFIKFQAPWLGHCKKMKPDWDTLSEQFKGNPNSLIGDVDCTADGKDLCEKHEVQGFPTIKWGSPDDLKQYEGGRSLADLKKFAEENLGPQCGPEHMDLCSDKIKAKIEGYLKMPADALDKKIKDAVSKVEVDVPIMKKAIPYLKKKEL